jgi:hypothetical protein
MVMDGTEDEFLAAIGEHFDAAFYLKTYADLAQTGMDPLEHWLNSWPDARTPNIVVGFRAVR